MIASALYQDLRYALSGFAGLLYDAPGTDAVLLAGAFLLVAAVSLFATYVPAPRAARTNPLESLRIE